MNDILSIADKVFKAQTLGYSIIPSGGGTKHKAPIVGWAGWQGKTPDENQLDAWEKEKHPILWGIVLNEHIGVIETDTQETTEEVKGALGEPNVTSPRKGGHWYINTTGHPFKTVAEILPGIGTRGVGGFANFVGTRTAYTENGVFYPTADYIINKFPIPGELIKWENLPARIKASTNGSIAMGPKKESAKLGLLPAEGWHDNLIKQIGIMRAKGIPEEQIMELAKALNIASGSNPLPDAEVLTMVRQYSNQARKDHYNLTDYGNAERLVSDHKDILHYCVDNSQWLIYTGKRWEWDTVIKATKLAKKTVRNMYSEAANEPDEKTRKEIANHAKASESNAKIETMLNQAKSEPGVAVKLSDLNCNKWLLNCQNGTINLKTGELQPHNPLDLITCLIPTSYNPDAKCSRWGSFIEWLTSGDAGDQNFIKKAVGYSLTGMTSAQVIFLLYGLGGNGKSTFLNTLKVLLDGYAGRLDAEDLMVSDRNSSRGQAKEGIADLQGKRFVVGSEITDNRQLNTSLVKDISGQDSVKARKLYSHDIEFSPECKVWLYGNHKPNIKDTTFSTWRRIKLILCNGTLTEGQKIEDYQEKYLIPELEGILAWAIEGCLLWQKEGLKDSQTIKSATDSYRADEDILGEFLADACVLENTASIGKKELKELYIKWLEDTKSDAIHSQKVFKTKLLEKGIIDGYSTDGTKRLWRGIRAKTPLDCQKISSDSDKTDKIIGTTDKIKAISPNFPLVTSHVRKLQENTIISSETSETSGNNLPDCPDCGQNEWSFSGDGKYLLCPFPCGYKKEVN